MEYIEISITTNTFASEYIAYILTELTGEGVSIYDKSDYEIGNWDYSDDICTDGEDVIVKGYVPKSVFDDVSRELVVKLEEARKLFEDVGSLDVFFKVIESDAWRDVWKETYKPIIIGGITVCPIWESEGMDLSKTVLIDPGLAFGTGQHETTSSVIGFLQEIEVLGKTVFDVGCGSGILGITALKLGAKEVLFLDNDEQAVNCALENLRHNAFNGKSTVFKNNLLNDISSKCDIMLANLTVDLIKRVDILNHMNAGGFIILSGILSSRLEEMKGFFFKDFYVVKEITIGEWSTILIKPKV